MSTSDAGDRGSRRAASCRLGRYSCTHSRAQYAPDPAGRSWPLEALAGLAGVPPRVLPDPRSAVHPPRRGRRCGCPFGLIGPRRAPHRRHDLDGQGARPNWPPARFTPADTSGSLGTTLVLKGVSLNRSRAPPWASTRTWRLITAITRRVAPRMSARELSPTAATHPDHDVVAWNERALHHGLARQVRYPLVGTGSGSLLARLGCSRFSRSRSPANQCVREISTMNTVPSSKASPSSSGWVFWRLFATSVRHKQAFRGAGGGELQSYCGSPSARARAGPRR